MIKTSAGQIVNGQTVTVNANASDLDVDQKFNVFNNTSNPVLLNVKRYELSYVAGSKNYFCWELCLNDINSGAQWLVTHPPVFNQINPGDSVTYFGAHVKPQGNPGTHTFRYVWFNTADANDSVYVDIVFNFAVSVNTIDKNDIKFELYPNPATHFTKINFNIPSSYPKLLVIYDMIGNKVFESSINNMEGSLNVDLSKFNNGVYFYSLWIDNKAILTRRLIVAR